MHGVQTPLAQARLSLKEVLEEQEDGHEEDAPEEEDALPGDLADFIGSRPRKATAEDKALRREQEKKAREAARKEERQLKQQETLNRFNDKVDQMSQADGGKCAKAAANLHSILVKVGQGIKKTMSSPYGFVLSSLRGLC